MSPFKPYDRKQAKRDIHDAGIVSHKMSAFVRRQKKAAALAPSQGLPIIRALDNWRHKIPFWWWLTYDAAVGVVIAVGVSPGDPAFWLGFFVLGIAVVIDTVEFIVKRPSAVAQLKASEGSMSP